MFLSLFGVLGNCVLISAYDLPVRMLYVFVYLFTNGTMPIYIASLLKKMTFVFTPCFKYKKCRRFHT